MAVTSLVRAESIKPKEVTVLIYYSGDNRLSDFMYSSYLRVLREGAGKDVNVVVQYDGEKKNDSFRAAIGTELDKNNPQKHVQKIYEKGVEYDMGNTKTLADFVAWGKKNFPAKRTMLVISSHGFGILNNPYPESENAKLANKNIDNAASSIDDTSRSFMKEQDMTAQLQKALGGQKLDLLIHNSCLMGSLESLSIMSAIAKYAIASEYSIYMNKNDDLKDDDAHMILIEKVISQIKQNPNVSEKEIGQKVVTDFGQHYKNFQAPTDQEVEVRFPTTLALYDLTAIKKLAQMYSDLANTLQAQAIKSNSVLMRLFDENIKARYIDSFGYIDVRILYKGMVQALYPAPMSDDVMKNFDSVLAQVVPSKIEMYTSQTEPIAHLHVFFPSILDQGDLRPYYKSYSEIDLVNSYGWPKFLNFVSASYQTMQKDYWVEKLKQWNGGAKIIVKPTSEPDSYDYDLFLTLSMMAFRLDQEPGKAQLKSYYQLLQTLTRKSEDLDKHRQEILNMLQASN